MIEICRWDVRPDGWWGLSRLRGWKWAGTSTSILAPCLRRAALSSWQDFTNGGEAFLQVRLLLMFWRGKHFPDTYLFKAKIRIFLKLIFGVVEGVVLVAKKVVISFPWGILNKHRRVALRTIGANSLQLICPVNNSTIARWRHVTTTTRILEFVVFLCKLRLLFFNPQRDWQI